MQNYKKSRIKASSLYESVVSITILSVVITISLMVFLNVTNNPRNQVGYYQLLDKVDEIRYCLIKNEGEIDESYFFKGYEIVVNKRDTGNEKNFLLGIVVLDKGRIFLKKEYVLNNEY
ncbi:hypothetical protein KUL156_28160 [Alteromonas sp. KUL156]|nr:hypothetical protein KUL154_02920 [Alteromonas sp. KUL154]GFE00224.1 hypothetical protein KUL156_28160 [Alteromonas sp. KUL156]